MAITKMGTTQLEYGKNVNDVIRSMIAKYKLKGVSLFAGDSGPWFNTIDGKNVIMLPRSRPDDYVAVAHEMGHAANAKKAWLRKGLLNPLRRLANKGWGPRFSIGSVPGAALIPFTDEDSLARKGAITAALAPAGSVLGNEGLASIRGHRAIKALGLPTDKTRLLKAFGTYAKSLGLPALGITGAGYGLAKLRDRKRGDN